MSNKTQIQCFETESITGSDGMRLELYGDASINTEQGFLKVNGNYDFGK